MYIIGLLKYFTPLVMSDSQKRRGAGLPSQPLPTLIRLYNAVLNHLISQACRTDLQHLQWPLPEFAPLKFSPDHALPPLHWNSGCYQQRLCHCLSALVMPDPRLLGGGGGGGGTEEKSWSRQCVVCMEFVRSVLARGVAGGMARGGGEEEEGQVGIPLFSR